MITDFEKFGIDPKYNVDQNVNNYTHKLDLDIKDIVEPYVNYNAEEVDEVRLLPRLKRLFLNNYCIFTDENGELIEGVVVDIFVSYNDFCFELDIFFDVKGQMFTIDPEYNIIVNSKKELMKRIYSDNDPYSEEEWDDEDDPEVK